LPVDPEGAEPVYLELADALELYAAIVGGTTAQAADQLRDRAGLESALGRPRNYALYEDADLALQAAALAHGIAESQTFIDGNKRLALIAMLTSLSPRRSSATQQGSPPTVEEIIAVMRQSCATLTPSSSRVKASRST